MKLPLRRWCFHQKLLHLGTHESTWFSQQVNAYSGSDIDADFPLALFYHFFSLQKT